MNDTRNNPEPRTNPRTKRSPEKPRTSHALLNTAAAGKKKQHDEVEAAPSRLAVKKTSVHSVNEAHRKEDMEKRKIALAARLASRNTGGGDDDEKGIADAARLTAQRESSKKLSTFPHALFLNFSIGII